MRMFTMFACKRSQIISVLGYYLLAGSSILALQQMVAKLHLCIFSIRSACGHLMTGEAVVTLAGSSGGGTIRNHPCRDGACKHPPHPGTLW